MNNGRSIIEQPMSRFTLITSRDRENRPGLEITIQDSLGSPAELISAGQTLQSGSRMISVERYRQWLLTRLDSDHGNPHRAAIQALPYCLKQAV